MKSSLALSLFADRAAPFGLKSSGRIMVCGLPCCCIHCFSLLAVAAQQAGDIHGNKLAHLRGEQENHVELGRELAMATHRDGG